MIRHGNRVWPILVVGRLMFNNTWDEFCDFHGLKIGYRVVFACERRWVFNTFLFNENGEQMTYNWTDPADAFQQLYPVPGVVLKQFFIRLIAIKPQLFIKLTFCPFNYFVFA